MGMFQPVLVRRPLGESSVEIRLGHELLDDYLRFVAARCQPNSVLAAGFDLKVFFCFVGKEPVEVTVTDVFAFIADQRLPRRGDNVVRLADADEVAHATEVATAQLNHQAKAWVWGRPAPPPRTRRRQLVYQY